MKNVIITISTFCLALVHVANAGNADPKKDLTKKYYNNSETVIMSPASVLLSNNKTIVEIIAEDNQITDQKVISEELLAAKKTIEEVIKENNQITDQIETE